MKKRSVAFIPALVAVAVGSVVLGYAFRGNLREFAYAFSRPSLPDAVAYVPPRAPEPTPVPDIVKPAPKPGTPVTVAKGTELEWTGSFVESINLSIPFLLQAPKQNWVQPFEDACEEASLLMADAYYDGRKTNFGADEGILRILEVVAYEDNAYGYNKDTTSDDVAHTAINYFKYKKAIVVDATETNIKAALAKGYPVIAPAYGKALLNPNFRNGGPEYHMLVIKGYLKDGRWITNDPGTRNGADYVYGKQLLLDAIHDYDASGMTNGRKVIIVILPNT